jgi:tetratricopeptide (TPR) repeat protein
MNRVIPLGIGLGLAMAAALCLGQAAPPPQSQRQTALALEQQGMNVEAEDAWRIFLNAHPSNPEPYAHLGLLEARQEHYKEAVPLYRKALALNPAMPGLRMNLGLALFKGGELKQAILEFKPLLKNQPPGSDQAQRLTILLGMAHYGLGEYAAAAPYLKQGRGLRSAESARATDPGAQLPVGQAVPVRSGYVHEILAAECGVGRGRYAGRRGAG